MEPKINRKGNHDRKQSHLGIIVAIMIGFREDQHMIVKNAWSVHDNAGNDYKKRRAEHDKDP